MAGAIVTRATDALDEIVPILADTLMSVHDIP